MKKNRNKKKKVLTKELIDLKDENEFSGKYLFKIFLKGTKKGDKLYIPKIVISNSMYDATRWFCRHNTSTNFNLDAYTIDKRELTNLGLYNLMNIVPVLGNNTPTNIKPTKTY